MFKTYNPNSSSKNNYFKYIFTIFCLLLLITFTACSDTQLTGNNSEYTYNDALFDTMISITVYSGSSDTAQKALNKAEEICNYYEELLDPDSTNGDVYHINNSSSSRINVSDDTMNILEKSLYYCNETDGLFDITINSVSSLWDFHGDTNSIPDETLIQSALKNVSYKNINLDRSTNSVIKLNPEVSIDIGSIAKGYIADSLATYLSSEAITGAIINIGGEIRTIGTKPNSTPFIIGIKNPQKNGEPILALEISNNMAIATSGTYERFIENGGKKYHHILNPYTGYPIETDLISSTIITDNAMDADTLCTICILYSSDKALKYIESLPNTEVILVKEDGTIIKSSGADQYIKH